MQLKRCLKMGNMPGGEVFFAGQSQFNAGVLGVFLWNWRGMAEKLRRLGVLTFFKQALVHGLSH